MSYQRRQSPKQQLSDFAQVFPRAAFLTGVGAITMSLVFRPAFVHFGLLEQLASLSGSEPLLPFFVASWMSLSLYITAHNMEAMDDELEDEAEEAAEDTVDVESDEAFKALWNAAVQTHEALAKMAHLVIIIAVGGLASAYVTATVAPEAGIVLAIALPMIEVMLVARGLWYLSPSQILLFPAIVALIPLTMGIALLGFVGGMVLALSQVLKTLLKTVAKHAIELSRISNIETPALDMFQDQFNQHGRR